MTVALDHSGEQRLMLRQVSWDFYERLLEEVDGQHLFISYDRGRLEMMSPSWRHEHYSQLLGALVRILASEFRLPLIAGGSTTFRIKASEAGLEPDGCFYIQNASAVLGKTEIDLSIDPPPDLAIEIEISRRLADRVDIYRRLGMPEIWCHNGLRLEIHCLEDGDYVVAERGRAFPQLTAAQLHELVVASDGIDETAWAEEVRGWLRHHLRSK